MQRIGIALLLLASCSNDTAPMECGPVMGNYLFTGTERSGDCGDFEFVVNLDPSTAGEGCEGTQTLSADGCSVESDLTCLFEDDAGNPSGLISFVGNVSQDGGPHRLTGLVTFEVSELDGTRLCVGTHDVTYSEL